MRYISKFIAVGLGFALTFTATNFIHGMFTSKAIQKNVITIQKPNIYVDAKHSYFYGKDTGAKKYNKLYIPVNISGIEGSKLDITVNLQSKNGGTQIKQDNITIGKGVHIEKDGYPNDGNKDCIIINLPNGLEFGVKEKYNVTLTVRTKNEKISIFEGEYWLEKQNQSNDCYGYGGARIQHIPMGLGHIDLNKSYEVLIDTVESTIPEVVEPPKEEVEEPNQPEIEEPPKVEETVVPSQPDIIEPSKEEVEIQE